MWSISRAHFVLTETVGIPLGASSLERRLSLAGKRFSPATAICPDGKLQFHDTATFFNYETAETSVASAELRRACVGR